LPDSTGPDYFDNQAKLWDFGVWLLAQPDLESSGFVERVNYAEHGSVTLLWHGEDEVLARALAEAAARGLGASVEQRPMTRADALAAQDKIVDLDGYLKQRGFDLDGVGAISGVTPDVWVMGSFVEGVEDVEGLCGELALELSEVVGAPVWIDYVVGRKVTFW
ncbi:MAG: hypothetical protein LBH76_06245, partial [Propionibacteriaceae bacterium]|jgi:hypothetical protein|nr:hypothetical protein [Propionibacteriaceae bacterium]